MTDSIILDSQLELLANVPLGDGPAAGVRFTLIADNDLGTHDTITTILGSLLDGDIPTGRRSGNRSLKLLVGILADQTMLPDPVRALAAIYAARELLVSIIDQDTFPLDLQPQGLPTSRLHCFRAKPTIHSDWATDKVGYLEVELDIPALPFAESVVDRSLTFGATSIIFDTLDTAPAGWAHWTASNVEGTASVVSLTPNTINKLTAWSGAPKDMTDQAAMAAWVRRDDSNPGRAYPKSYVMTIRDKAGRLFLLGTKTISMFDRRWYRVTWPIAAWPAGFDYRNVTGYKLEAKSPSFVDWIHTLPSAGALYSGARGQVVEFGGIEGSVRAPARLELALPDGRLFGSALVHVPPPDAPDDFLPIVPYEDIAIGNRHPVPAVNGKVTGPRFNGTYAVWFAADAEAGQYQLDCWQVWNDPSGRVLPGVTQTLAAQVIATVTASEFRQGLVYLGAVTLPGLAAPPENTETAWQFACKSSIPNKIIHDVLLLDVRGSTVVVGSPTQVKRIWIDPPIPEDLYGGVYAGSDRTRALSVLADSVVSGEPLPVHPNVSRMFVYSTNTSLDVTAGYRPRWYALDPGSQPVPSDVSDPYPTLYSTTY